MPIDDKYDDSAQVVSQCYNSFDDQSESAGSVAKEEGSIYSTDFSGFRYDEQQVTRPERQFRMPFRISKAAICIVLSIAIEITLLVMAFTTNIVKVAMETSLGSYLGFQAVLILNAFIVCLISRIGEIRFTGYLAVAISIAATWYSFYEQVFDGNGPTETGFLERAFVSVTAFLLFGAASLGVSAACAGITKLMKND